MFKRLKEHLITALVFAILLAPMFTAPMEQKIVAQSLEQEVQP